MNCLPKASRALLVNAFTVHRRLNMPGLLAGLFNLPFKLHVQVRLCNLTWALYSRGRRDFDHQWPGPVWWPRRECRQGILPGQRPVSGRQAVLRSADQEVASRHTLLQRLLRPGNLAICVYFKCCYMVCCALNRISCLNNFPDVPGPSLIYSTFFFWFLNHSYVSVFGRLCCQPVLFSWHWHSLWLFHLSESIQVWLSVPGCMGDSTPSSGGHNGHYVTYYLAVMRRLTDLTSSVQYKLNLAKMSLNTFSDFSICILLFCLLQ